MNEQIADFSFYCKCPNFFGNGVCTYLQKTSYKSDELSTNTQARKVKSSTSIKLNLGAHREAHGNRDSGRSLKWPHIPGVHSKGRSASGFCGNFCS